ncbi:tRNA/rRNA methyltransferase (SpoU) [Segniliparus rotundus DSM 44985]|uniref:Putative tRNA (cytidine(34)-2'-O)-methyltransferase n=1 Tax=Segniliparus rotundus (strain ATCC BAA-972 / CDC 1076 / CIP 108378 / DSM 44985 / JCM 13578) TaxID=640132 RepID=D6Z8S1_SEGRD|nr:tRNA (cytidine(34)-2'-O)-methyltransferase [Segniliparus rotundus]ADG98351.1 tRNA/rRNA methyltransferase (SpoU) [Segniliparus rotundus DSM 44985]
MFRVMLFEPRIAGNTGSLIRVSAATGCELHLVEPLGFGLSEPKLRRAGLDYHDLAHVVVHPGFDEALAAVPDARIFAFTVAGSTRHDNIAYQAGDVLLFGPEPTGLPAEVAHHPRVSDRARIPMLAGRRSLNLANAATIAVYEAWRQHGFAGGS